MVFVTPKYTIRTPIHLTGRTEILEDLELDIRKCYQSEGAIKEGSAERLVNMIIKKHHDAMIELAPDLKIWLITCRGITHEIVRNRLFSFAQESTRYVKYGEIDPNTEKREPMQFLIPPWIIGQERQILLSREWNYATDEFLYNYRENSFGLSEATWRFLISLAVSEENYSFLRHQGWAAEKAREVLPNALKTEIVIKGNLRQWRHFFKLRCDKPAHPQMREWTIPLFNELCAAIPEFWADLANEIDLDFDFADKDNSFYLRGN
jgi:thymidylate synthase (FAD)